MHAHHSPPQRVPLALQSVFLASNRGSDVVTPPPQNVASRTYFGFRGRKGPEIAAPPLCLSPIRKHRVFSFGSPKKDQHASPKKISTKTTINVPTSVVANPAGKASPKKSSRLPSLSPQSYLDALMSNRGYCTDRVKTIDTAYYSAPTPLQKASYHCFLINMVKSGDVAGFTSLMSAGLSTNPANNYGESLCHLICRLGNNKMLAAFLECGGSLDVSDDFGRTPLHDACWASAPAFDVIDTIMTAMGSESYHLFTMVDKRGATPLSYARQEHWAEWMEFLVSKKDVYWPTLDKSKGKKVAPDIARAAPQSRPILNPEDALPTELASMVASGSISPAEARMLVDDDSESCSSDDDDSSWDDLECDEYMTASDYMDAPESSSDDEDDVSIAANALSRVFRRMGDSSSKVPMLSDSSSTLREMAHILDCLNGGRAPISWSA